MGNNAKISVENGVFQFGYSLNNQASFPSYGCSGIKMGANSKITIKGDVFIGPGSMILVREGGQLVLEGNNCIAHNALIYCGKEIVFGKNSSASWNCTFMDWDGHQYQKLGAEFHYAPSPLNIGANVGIQMNVTIPKGIQIGENSIIAANSVLRENVPSNSLAYTNNELRIKNGYSSGLGLIKNFA